jgi:hypothetical protein
MTMGLPAVCLLMEPFFGQSIPPKPNSGWTVVEFSPSATNPRVFDARSGHYRLFVGQPDQTIQPDLWDSPVSITDESTQKSCKSQPLLIHKVYVLEGASPILVVSINGSMTLVDLIDPASCKTLQRIAAFSEGVAVQGAKVLIKPGCECPNADGPCSCASGRVFRLSSGGKLRVLLDESDALTVKELGVSFRGNRRVLHPRTKEAKLQ